jgi:hypothetical protein
MVVNVAGAEGRIIGKGDTAPRPRTLSLNDEPFNLNPKPWTLNPKP